MSAPDAAEEIADRALRFDCEYPEDRAEAVVAALARAGWLCDPAEVAALRKVAAAARTLVKGDPEQDADNITELGWAVDALDAS